MAIFPYMGKFPIHRKIVFQWQKLELYIFVWQLQHCCNATAHYLQRNLFLWFPPQNQIFLFDFDNNLEKFYLKYARNFSIQPMYFLKAFVPNPLTNKKILWKYILWLFDTTCNAEFSWKRGEILIQLFIRQSPNNNFQLRQRWQRLVEIYWWWFWEKMVHIHADH